MVLGKSGIGFMKNLGYMILSKFFCINKNYLRRRYNFQHHQCITEYYL